MSLLISKTESVHSLTDLLQIRMQTQPNDNAFIFLRDGDTDAVSLTYHELHKTACIIAGYLQKKYQSGDRALLIYPSGLEFICAFFGCLYAGLLPVPVQAPRVTRGFAQLEAVIANAQPAVVLTDLSLELFVTNNLPNLVVIATDKLDSHHQDSWQLPYIDQKNPAFLQYTSGSTGVPKGVIVSHENVLHNQSIIKQAFQHNDSSIIVGWLPFYHDMGLIGNMLQPIYLGRPCIFMQPITFIQNPFLWLQAISRYKATTSGGPSFAYELCLRKITPEQLNNLDLQSWRIAFNGSEPVRAKIIHQFAAYFSTANFKKSAFFPCYGMAEATLFITGSNHISRPVIEHIQHKSLANNKVVIDAQESNENIEIVGCGQSSVDQTVVIVSPATLTKCAANEVGEIWVSGPSIAQGYWNNIEATKHDFHAKIKNSSDESYLRTGDLGFFHNNELFITGRLKDLIIIRGSNYYAHDIEQIVEKSHPALKPTCGAAFSIEIENEEKLVIVQEVEREHIRKLDNNAVSLAIRQAIIDHFNLNIHNILLLRTGQIPKTSSGKVKRRACKQKYLENSFQSVGSTYTDINSNDNIIISSTSTDPTTVQELFIHLASKLLKIEKTTIDIHSPLIHYGIDSILATNFQAQIESHLHIRWPVSRFLTGESLAQLAASAQNEPRLPQQAIVEHHLSEYPLSPTQEGMYFLYQYSPENTVNNVYFALRIQQTLHFKAWEIVWKMLIERHPLLRTTFHTENGHTFQKIQPSIHNKLQYISYFNQDEASLKTLLTEEACRPFILEKEPPYRLQLYHINSEDYVFLFSAHHIACDLQSIFILMHEFGALYEQYCSQSDLYLPPIPSHFAEYTYDQITSEDPKLRQRDKDYWTQQLSGDLPVLNLPTINRRPPFQTFRGASSEFSLKKSLSDALRVLAKNQDMTVYMVLMASYQLLLHRYTQQDDILVGNPVSGRHRSASQHIVGCFINTIVIRTKYASTVSFLDLLRQTRQTILEAFEHQEYPFQQLVAQLKTQRDVSRPAVFQAMLILQNAQFMHEAVSLLFSQNSKSLNLNGLPLQLLPLDKQSVLYDLTLVMADTPEGILCRFEYNSDLFDTTSIKNLERHFKKLLEEMIRDPSQSVDQVSLLSIEEEQQLLMTSKNNRIELSATTDFMLSIIRQAQHYPKAIAAECDQKQLSYQELHLRSNQLANYLQTQGVGPEVLIGVLLNRSCEMLITLLGILKAGGAYLPLDPNYPVERLAYMLTDAKPALLITQQEILDKIPNIEIKKLNLDELTRRINQQPTDYPAPSTHTARLAYMIYTSGSTGKPKGVLIQYDSLNNFLQAMRKSFVLTTEDKWLAVTTISFDISILELFLPIMVGAAVVIAGSKETYNADDLIHRIQQSNVTIMQATPSTWHMLVARNWYGFHNFKALIGGEVLSPVLAKKLQQGGCAIWNLYGPTENTVWTTLYAVDEIKQDKFGHLGSIPIGKPIDNVQTFILDRHLNLLPIGIPGELYIGGVGISRGYLNQPELTQDKFISNPFSNTERLYATGDQARYLPDGNIEYLSRIDNQIKLRGYRIELGEIENALLSHNLVTDCAVIFHPGNENEGGFLVAYLVTKEPVAMHILQEFLRENLPTYMVPTVFEYLTTLPRTENNKINRKALLGLRLEKRISQTDIIAPKTEAEKILAAIWMDCLNLSQISIQDNFFYLGGHSLLALRISNTLLEQHNIHLPLHVFFENQTIEKLAVEVATQMQAHHNNTAAIIDRIKNLSPEEVKRLLEDKKRAKLLVEKSSL